MINDTHDHRFSQDQRDFTRLAYRTVDAIAEHLNQLSDMAVDNAVPPREQRNYLANMAQISTIG